MDDWQQFPAGLQIYINSCVRGRLFEYLFWAQLTESETFTKALVSKDGRRGSELPSRLRRTAPHHQLSGLARYSAAIWRGAGGGLTRSAANCVYRALASCTAFSFTGP